MTAALVVDWESPLPPRRVRRRYERSAVRARLARARAVRLKEQHARAYRARAAGPPYPQQEPAALPPEKRPVP